MSDDNKQRLVTDDNLPSNLTEQIHLFEALAKRFDDRFGAMETAINSKFSSMEKGFFLQIQQIRGEIEDLKKEFKSRNCFKEEKIKEIEKQGDDNESAIRELKDEVSKNSSSIGWKILTWVLGVVVVVVAVGIAYGRVDSTATRNENQVKSLDSASRAHGEKIVEAFGRIERLDKDVDKLDERMTISESRSNLLSESVDGVKHTLEIHNHRIGRRR